MRRLRLRQTWHPARPSTKPLVSEDELKGIMGGVNRLDKLEGRFNNGDVKWTSIRDREEAAKRAACDHRNSNVPQVCKNGVWHCGECGTPVDGPGSARPISG